MPTIRSPKTKVKVVPRDGELEITLNINISVDGQLSASSDDAEVSIQSKTNEEDKVDPIIPDFNSGGKLSGFGLWKKKE